MTLARLTLPLLALLALSALPARAAEDQLAKLTTESAAPARFASHIPNFSAQKEEFTFKKADGTLEKTTFWTIKDSDKYVATLHIGMLQLDQITFDPTKAPAKPPFAPDRYSWACLLGTRITASVWPPGEMGMTGDTKTIEFTGGGKTLTLKTVQEWTTKRKAKAVYTMTLRLDPVAGYVWDATTTYASADNVDRDDKGNPKTDKAGKPIPALPEFFNWQVKSVGWANGKPKAWVCEKTLFYREDDKIVGFYLNPIAIDRSKFKKVAVKPGGFVAKLPDQDHWGVALVHVDKPLWAVCKNNTCNMWSDSHNYLLLPEKPDAGGMYRVEAKWRFQGVVPELTDTILKHVAEMDELGHEKTASNK